MPIKTLTKNIKPIQIIYKITINLQITIANQSQYKLNKNNTTNKSFCNINISKLMVYNQMIIKREGIGFLMIIVYYQMIVLERIIGIEQ